MCSASLDNHPIALGVRRNSSKRIFAPMFQNESDGFGQARSRFFFRSSLAIGAWNLRAVSDVPIVVTFEYCRKFLVHSPFNSKHD